MEDVADLDRMNFQELLSENVGLAMKLELVWFAAAGDIKHSMPFLSRNLVYIRSANEGKKARRRKALGSIFNRKEDNNKQKLDILLELFQHRAELYNDDLLDRTKSAKSTPVRVTAMAQKRKRDNTDDISSEEVLEPGGQPAGQILLENLAANDKNGDACYPEENDPKRQKQLDNTLPPFRQMSSDDGVPTQKQMSSDDGRNDSHFSSTTRAQTAMYFCYLFLGENGVPCVHVEERRDRRCPLCFHDAVSDTGMMLHCEASHGHYMYFKSARSEDGELYVTATFGPSSDQSEGKEQLKDFVFVAPPLKSLPAVPFVNRSAHKVASLDLQTRKRRALLLQEMGADDRIKENYFPNDKVPIRQYFHSKTYQPMIGGDWDVDSDEDSTTDKWHRDITSLLLDDFTDMDSEEKNFMKLWNQFIKSITVIPDHSIPKRCLAFIQAHAADLNGKDLRQELVLHLHNLWDHGLLSSDNIVECMVKYDSLVRQDEKNGDLAKVNGIRGCTDL